VTVVAACQFSRETRRTIQQRPLRRTCRSS